jgi:hypothetical protein
MKTGRTFHNEGNNTRPRQKPSRKGGGAVQH